ncbi:MAG TPA: hypothetical protein VEL70_04585 [Candidatus Acidoferrum sp.]|nr:hypothetical protein [Candidatus Acidoferrum sp.]
MGIKIRIIVPILAGIASLMSVFIYLHGRSKIPKLSFDGYFKFDKQFVTDVPSKVTIYCVRIEDMNTRSEGKVRSCTGSLIVNSNIYRTVWVNGESRYYTFVKEALLKLFEVDWNGNTIGFFNTLLETKAEPILVPYTENIHNNIIIGLQCSRGYCPESMTVSIEDIINNAESLAP